MLGSKGKIYYPACTGNVRFNGVCWIMSVHKYSEETMYFYCFSAVKQQHLHPYSCRKTHTQSLSSIMCICSQRCCSVWWNLNVFVRVVCNWAGNTRASAVSVSDPSTPPPQFCLLPGNYHLGNTPCNDLYGDRETASSLQWHYGCHGNTAWVCACVWVGGDKSR